MTHEHDEQNCKRTDHLLEEIYRLILDFYQSEGGQDVQITKQQVREKVLFNLHFAVTTHILNIRRAGRRRKAATTRALLRLINNALVEAAQQDANRPSAAGSTHTH